MLLRRRVVCVWISLTSVSRTDGVPGNHDALGSSLHSKRHVGWRVCPGGLSKRFGGFGRADICHTQSSSFLARYFSRKWEKTGVVPPGMIVLRSKQPKWSAWHGCHTLDFDRGGER